MNVSMELGSGDQDVGRSRDFCGISLQVDFSRDSHQIRENAVKAELCSPGPATPMQVAPLPQQKPRDVSTSCPTSATTRSTHSFEAAETSCELQLASKSLPASTQDGVQSETGVAEVRTGSKECCVGGSHTAEWSCPVLVAAQHGVGDRSVSSDLGRMGGPTKAVWKDEGEVRAASKSSEEEASMSRCGAIERASCERSTTSMGRASSIVKVERSGLAVDAGLRLGSDGVRLSGCVSRAGVDFSRVWEKVGGSGGGSGDCDVGSSRDEGAVVLQLLQGRGGNGGGAKGGMGMGGDWKGKYLQLSMGVEAEEKVGGGRVEGNAEDGGRQVVDEDAVVGAEDGGRDCTELSNDRLMKRVKREVVEGRMSVDGSGEQMWGRNEDRVAADRRRSGSYESKQEDFRNLFWGNGAAALLSQRYREEAFGKVLEVGIGVPKTVVVKKTPKRVHNSDPNAMFMRSELLMFEDSMRSPGSVPHVMFSPSNKQGRNGSMFTSDFPNLGNQHSARKSGNFVCGRDRGMEYVKGVHNNSSAFQFELESRLDRASSCSLMSTSKDVPLMGEASLPLSLNFQPKPQRAVVPSSRTSTEEEWGKSLALCGPGAESPGEVERGGEEAKALSYQERFAELQLFLKKCDEDEQSYLSNALRSLSAAGRSSHAVGLEQRALWLSIEEGKEMTRLKSLNVMGQRSSMNGQSDVGCTPRGPRVPPFGNGAEYAHQQSLANTRSPRMQMQMLMSGSTPGSAYKESYRFG